MGRILKKARECKHSVEEVRTGDAAVHMPRSKAIWTTCGNQGGNGVQFNVAALVVMGKMRADERGCGNQGRA